MPVVERRADRQRLVGRGDPLDELVDDRGVRDHPAQRGAALPGGAGRREHDAAHGEVEVGRRRDDRGVVAAELEQQPAEAAGDARRDGAAHPGRAGGAEQRDARVVDERLADLGAAEDHAPTIAGRRADAAGGLGDQRLAGQRGEQRLLRRLPHDRVAADEGERGVPRPHRDREVEGADDADDPERVPLLHHPVAGPLGGDGQPVQLARQADGEVADVDHLLDLAEALGADLAGLDGDERAEVGLVLAQQLAELADERAAHRRRHGAPLRGTRPAPRRRSSATSAAVCARSRASSPPVIGRAGGAGRRRPAAR